MIKEFISGDKTHEVITGLCVLVSKAGEYKEYKTYDKSKEYLKDIWRVMKESVERGLKKDGVLPGGLKVLKKAKYIYQSDDIFVRDSLLRNKLTCAYALAVAEENADNGVIVTAPTCGAAGVLPAVLYYAYKNEHVSEEVIINALATAGLIGNIVKTNARGQ